MALRVAFTLLQCWHRVPGGTARAALELAGALAARGDVELVGVGPAGSGPARAGFEPTIPVRRLPLPYQAVYDLWSRTSMLSPERVTGAVDVVHVTAPTVPARRNAPVIVTLHDVFPITHPQVLTRRGARLLGRGVELAKTRADLVLCSSEQTLEQCRSIGFDPERLRMVPLGVRPSMVADTDRTRVLDRYGLDSGFLLWVGTVEPRKNLATLVRAFRDAELGETELILVGPAGWDESMAALLAAGGPRCRSLGAVPASDLGALYAEATALVFPSLAEGFGLPALEAMAQGTPVIGSSGTAIAEVVLDTGLLVDPSDASALAAAMQRIVSDGELRSTLGEQSRRRSLAYTWDRTAELTVAAYREVIDG